MRSYTFFLLITFFTTILCSAQSETNIDDGIEKHIHKKIKEAIKLYHTYEYKKALIIAKNCIKKSDSIKNDSLLGKSYIINGIVNTYLNKEAEAIRNHRKAEVIFTKIKNYKMIGLAYHNIAFSYNKNSKNIDSAIVYYKKALKMYESTENKSKMAVTANNLGINYLRINKLNKAEIYLKKAIHLSEINNKKDVLCSAYSNFSKLYHLKNDFKKALKALNISQKIAEEKNYEEILVNLYELKSKILEKQGDIKNAHIYLKKYNTFLNTTHEFEKYRLKQEASVKFDIKENKVLLAKTKLENTMKTNELKKSMQVMSFIIILFLASTIASILLYKNNTLKHENNKLLILKNEELQELQHQTELNFLKTQVQPRFFFNTLAILHTLILEKSEMAEDVVIKLSELMQYSIYETKKENVSIWDEINSIQNYLDLEGIYKRQKAFPSIKINGNIDHIKVPPLLYFSLIEDCFKSKNTKGKNIELAISFNNLDGKYLLFNLKNQVTLPELKNDSSNEMDVKNIKRRLNLIYQNNYSLKAYNENNSFNLSLKTPI